MHLSTTCAVVATFTTFLLGILQIQGIEFPESVVTDLQNLPLDSNDRLADNWLLVLDNPHCRDSFRNALSETVTDYRKIAVYSQEISDSFFGNSETLCNAVCLVKGTSADLLQYALPSNMMVVLEGQDSDGHIYDWISGNLIPIFYLIFDSTYISVYKLHS